MKLLELSLFYNNLSVMLSSGVGLVTLFESISSSERDPRKKSQFKFIIENLKKGSGLAITLKHSGLIPVFDIPIIESGEKSGQLAHVFDVLGKNYELSAQAEKNARSGLLMPFFTLAGALFLPRFPDLFLGKITMAQYLRGSLIPLFILVGLGFSIHAAYLRSYYDLGMAKLRHRIFMSLPILRGLAQKMALEKFCSALALMLEAGLPIFDALKLAGETSADDSITSATQRIVSDLKKGKSLPLAFRAENVFSDDIKNSITLGNESGKLPAFITRSAGILKKDVNTSIEKISKALPVIVYWSVVAYVAWTIISFQMERIKMLNQIIDI